MLLWFLPTLKLNYYGSRGSYSGIRILREAGFLSNQAASQMAVMILFLMAVNFIILILHIYLPGKKPAMALIYNIVFDIFYLLMITGLILSMEGYVYPGFFGIILIIVLICSVYIQQKILKEQVIENYFHEKIRLR